MIRHSRRLHRGRAVREVVMVALVVGLLIMLLMPLILNRQESARRLSCRERQRQLWKATEQYEELHEAYPTYRVRLAGSFTPDDLPPVSWAGAILPLLTKSQPAGDPPQVTIDRFLDADPQQRGSLEEIYFSEFVCPTDPRVEKSHDRAFLSYVANTGMRDAEASETAPADWPANGVLMNGEDLTQYQLLPPSLATLEQGDGANQTLLFSENVDAGLWTDHEEPRIGFVWEVRRLGRARGTKVTVLDINQSVGKGDGSYRFARPSSLHGRGVNMVFCSGRLQFLAEDIDHLVLANLMNSDITQTQRPGTNEPLPPPYRLEVKQSGDAPTSPPAAPRPPQR